ncbi:hypothetical protein CEP54_001478 [Fusarium duplospermum]|uniref:Uncharacterized protein n=1 Tax=Fusarium duplospermum TaxID=1325734 RepID=A0A428R0A4_9HYPO|nr:hypothetical protein CEP54_001478 [Fusarium duplospermum]
MRLGFVVSHPSCPWNCCRDMSSEEYCAGAAYLTIGIASRFPDLAIALASSRNQLRPTSTATDAIRRHLEASTAVHSINSRRIVVTQRGHRADFSAHNLGKPLSCCGQYCRAQLS